MAEIDIPYSVLSQYTDGSLSNIYHTLRSSRRRLAVMLLAYRVITDPSAECRNDRRQPAVGTSDVELSVRQLAREITGIEEGISIEKATGEPYRNIYTALCQSHLKRLDEIGAINYDADRKVVSPDQNLLALAVALSTTSNVMQLLFHAAVADAQTGWFADQNDSIGN